MPSTSEPSTTRRLEVVASRRFAIAIFSVALPYAGCSLDERTLSLDAPISGSSNSSAAGGRGGTSHGGAAGALSPAAGSAGSRAGGQAAQAGQAGEGGEAEGGQTTFRDGCSDLDRNGISDCNQTLLLNPNFATDILHWLPETGATLAWDPLDLLGTAGSGSALVTSAGAVDAAGNQLVAAFQCIPVHEGRVVSIWANARIDPGAGSGEAAIHCWFFANPDCPGESPGVAMETASSRQTGKTITLSGAQPVPDFMVSMRVRLAVIKPFMASSFSVRFDNLLVVER